LFFRIDPNSKLRASRVALAELFRSGQYGDLLLLEFEVRVPESFLQKLSPILIGRWMIAGDLAQGFVAKRGRFFGGDTTERAAGNRSMLSEISST
jgi:hypothetical protein